MSAAAPQERPPWHGPASARGALVAGGVVVTTAAALAGAALTRALTPSVLYDPGPVVRFGLPVAHALGDLAAVLTVGFLVLATVVLPVHGTRTAHPPALAAATGAAAAWAVARLTVAVLTCADLTGVRLGETDFGQQLTGFLLGPGPGRGLLLAALLPAVLATLVAGTRSMAAAALSLLLALVALVPGAAATGAGTTPTTPGLHLLGAGLWIGTLGGLLLLGPELPGPVRVAALRRYVALVPWALVAIAVPGIARAWGNLAGVAWPYGRYGVLVGLKALALAVAAVAVVRYRPRTVQAPGSPVGFGRAPVVQAAVLAAALGAGAALAGSTPPLPDTPPAPPSAAELLTGYPLPADPAPLHWLTLWRPDPLWVVLLGVAAVGYLAGVRRLRTRGDRWSAARTASWLTGLAVLAWATCGAPAVHGRVAPGPHLVGNVVLGTLVPLLLAPAAPVTLLRRAVPPRGDGSRGAREWAQVVSGSRLLRSATRPVVAALLFATGAAVALSPLLGATVTTLAAGRPVLFLVLPLAGYPAAWLLVGTDPAPASPVAGMRPGRVGPGSDGHPPADGRAAQ